MDASQVKEILSDQDIFSLLNDLGGEAIWNNGITSRTICHNHSHEGKHKLVYYQDSKTFHCFTECGTMDIFGLVGRVMDLDFYSSFRYVCMKFGISITGDYQKSDKIDTSYFKKFKKRNELIELNTLDEKVLNSYYNLYHNSWIEDGIGIDSMKKFGIKLSIMDNQIVIPHRDINGKLIGVRARNLKKELVDEGRKYMPVWWKGQSLKHPTGACLYGLDKTKKYIEKYKTIILFESEKSVLQLDTMYPDRSIGVCLSGSSMTNHQLEILKNINIEEVVIALDKEYKEVGTQEEKFYAKKIENVFSSKLSPYYRTSVLWDTDNLLEEKDSPTDRGIEVFDSLYKNRIFIQ